MFLLNCTLNRLEYSFSKMFNKLTNVNIATFSPLADDSAA